MALGVVTSMLAAWIPARNAARVEPVQALQKGKYQVLSAGENRVRRQRGVGVRDGRGRVPVSDALPAAVLLWDTRCSLLAALLLVPFLSQALVKVLRVPLKWLRPVEGALAADSLLQAPRRTSATVAALVLSLALVVGQGGVARGSMESIDEWVTRHAESGSFRFHRGELRPRDFHFPPAMQQALEQVPGVAEVQPVRSVRVQYHGLPLLIVAIDEAKVAKRVQRHVIAGRCWRRWTGWRPRARA